MANKDLEKIQEELKWVRMREEHNNTFFEKLKSKGITGILVPAGCLVTVGVLCRGLYFFKKRNNRAQQLMMRYRVGAQGITIALAMISVLAVPLTKNK